MVVRSRKHKSEVITVENREAGDMHSPYPYSVFIFWVIYTSRFVKEKSTLSARQEGSMGQGSGGHDGYVQVSFSP